MIDATERVPLTADLDTLLAVADDERLAYCETCGCFVPDDESHPASADPNDDTRVCEDCYDSEQEAIRAEIEAEQDALHAEAARYRAAGIDPQLAMWMARHRMTG